MPKLRCFKAYDVRGRIPDEINETLAYDIGRAYAAFVKPKRVAVGYDIRLSSPQLAAACKRGLLDCGADVLDNRSVEIVEFTDADNRVVTVSFSTVSKLPVRQSTFRRDRVTNLKVEEVTLFSKYRDVGHGVMWPYDIQRQRDGEKIFEIFSESVTINQDLKDNLFTLPANLKILKPVK